MPLYGARADGLFADHNLNIEFVPSPPGPKRVKALAAGAGEFLLTSLLYYLQALDEEGPLKVRPVAAVHGRSSMAALVRDDSDITTGSDLAGRRLGGPDGTEGLGWLLRECRADLALRGVTDVDVVALAYRDAAQGLRAGLVDAVPNLAELAPLVARALGTDVRGVPVGSSVYLSGLLAGSWVADDVIERMRTALREALVRQRDEPRCGVDLLRDEHPEVNADDAVASWLMLEPYVFGDDDPGGFNAQHWRRTVAHLGSVHDLPRASELALT